MKRHLPLAIFWLLAVAVACGFAQTRPTTVRLTDADGSYQDFQLVPTTQVGAEVPATPLSNQSRLRVNLDTPDSNSTFHLFIDAGRSAWPVGANGGPLNQVVFVEQVAAAGTYTLLTENTIVARAGPVAGDDQLKPVPGDGRVHHVVVPPGQASLRILYSAPPGKVKILRPGYTSDRSIFTAEALVQLKPFGGVRCMDLLRTNGSTVTDWASRLTQPWTPEDCIALANATGKDIWLNIPHGATDDYVRGLKGLVEASLRGDVNCYVEYANEQWNSADVFGVSRRYALALARNCIAMREPGFIEANGSINETYGLWRWHAKRSAEISRILGPRFKVILAGQNAEPAVCRLGLEYVAKYIGPPKDYFYAIASAPYFGLSAADQEKVGLTADQVAELLVAGSNPAPDKRAAHKAIAKTYGLRYFGYEGGGHLHRSASPQAVVDAQMLPRTGEAYEKYFANVLGDCDEFYQFVLSSNWGWKEPKIVPPATQPGPVKDTAVWGLTPGTQRFVDCPKWMAARDAAAKYR